MAFYFSNDYSGVQNAKLAGEGQASTNYFNLAHLVAQQKQQDIANAITEANMQQQAKQAQQSFLANLMQNQQSQAWHKANADLAQKKFTEDLAQNKINSQLAREQFDFTKEQNLGKSRLMEQDALAMLKSLEPLANEGTLEDAHFTHLPEAHQNVLRSLRDTARQQIEGRNQTLGTAAKVLDRQAELNRQIAEAEKNKPGYFFRNSDAAVPEESSPLAVWRKRGELEKSVEGWNKELKNLESQLTGADVVAAQALPVNAAGLRVMPNLPWMKPAATTNVAEASQAVAPNFGVSPFAPSNAQIAPSEPTARTQMVHQRDMARAEAVMLMNKWPHRAKDIRSRFFKTYGVELGL